jgi:hypothetical protein
LPCAEKWSLGLFCSSLERFGSGALHLVDGQHRVEASRKLIDEDAKWEDFVVPFVCMVGATEAEEIEQFYVVNSRAKSVRTDLALLLLRTIADRDPKMLERLEEKGRDWHVPAEKLVEVLADNNLVWRGLIRLLALPLKRATPPASGPAAPKPNEQLLYGKSAIGWWPIGTACGFPN